MDWIQVNNHAESMANAKFQVIKKELHIVAKQEIPPSYRDTEIFVNYGDVQVYWIPLIATMPQLFTNHLLEPVRWLLNSPKSNWTREQKLTWSNLSLEQIASFPKTDEI